MMDCEDAMHWKEFLGIGEGGISRKGVRNFDKKMGKFFQTEREIRFRRHALVFFF